MKNNFIELPIPTRDGQFVAHYSEKGLAGLDFPKVGQRRAAASGHRSGDVPTVPTNAISALASSHGSRVEKHPRRTKRQKNCRRSIWPRNGISEKCLECAAENFPRQNEKLRRNRAAIGKPKAVRAVGGACGANPIPVLVPCHRVLAANKKLGGFSGGLDWKRTLLAREGVSL